jgi:hypothetical protein
MMRTTLNLDDDVAAELAARAHRESRSLSRIANDLMRSGIRAGREKPPARPYRPPTFDTGRPLVDVTDIASALEVLEQGG